MVYLFYGLEEFLIDKEIKKILIDNKIDDYSINEYDLENTLLNEIIDDASTIPLFGDKKGIIVDNSYIFSANSKKTEQDTKTLEQYLNNINTNTILIFKILKESVDSRKKIYKIIKEKGKVLEFNKVTNINTIVKKLLDNYNIADQNITLLVKRVGNNLNILEHEIEKLKTYKGNDLNITKDDIVNVTIKTVNIDIFELIENIITNKKEKAIESYNEMLKYNEEPIKIIIMLANQIRIMYQSKELIKLGYTEKNIADLLQIHPYRVKLALEKSRNYSSKVLLNYLEQLADLDINIKSGNIDKNLGLELFILNI